MVIVFPEEMLMRTICLRVLLGTWCPDHWQQGHEDMLLSYQLVDGYHTFASVLSSSGIRCWVWICETVLFVSCSCVFPKACTQCWAPAARMSCVGKAVLARRSYHGSGSTLGSVLTKRLLYL